MASLSEYINANYPNPVGGDNPSSFMWGGVQYTWDSEIEVWTSFIPDPGAITDAAVSPEAPSNPVQGQLWFNGERLMVYEIVAGPDDSSIATWVDASPQLDVNDLSIESNLTVAKGATNISSVNSINVSSSQGSGTEGSVTLTGGNGTASINIEFPTVPNVPATVPANNTETKQYVVSKPAGVGSTPTYVDLSTTLAADTSILKTSSTLSDISDISTTPATNGQVLTWNNTDRVWAPATPSGSGSVSIDSDGNTITIGSDSTEIPVITGGSVSGTNLTLTTNGDGDDIVIMGLPSAGMVNTNPLTVGNNANINTLRFSPDAVSITTSGDNDEIATVEIPGAELLVVTEDGNPRSDSVKTINFEGTGVSVSDEGDNEVKVTITGGSGATPEQTALANINSVDSTLGFGSTSDKSQFTVTGRSGGSKHKIILKNNTASAIQLKWISNNNSTKALTLTGSKKFGIWDPANNGPYIRLVEEGTTSSFVAWVSNSNRSVDSREVLLFDLDLVENGTFQIMSNSSDLVWYHSAETLDVDSIEIMDVPESATPPEPAPAITPVGVVSTNYEGLFISPDVADFDGTMRDLNWDLKTNFQNLIFSEIMGGNNGLSISTGEANSLMGNDFWGTNSDRPRAGLWVESWGQSAVGTNQNLHGIGIVLPENDGTDEVLEYLDMFAGDDDWVGVYPNALRGDSLLVRASNGAILGDGTANSSLQIGRNKGIRVGFHSHSGPDNGPFSDQYTMAAASPNYDLGYNIQGTTIGEADTGFSGLSFGVVQMYNRIVVSVPNDPSKATLEVRKRGKLISGGDPYLANDADSVQAYVFPGGTDLSSGEVGTGTIVTSVSSPVASASGIMERQLTVDVPKTTFKGNNDTTRIRNARLWARALVGSQVSPPAGSVSGTNLTIKRISRGPNASGVATDDVTLDTDWIRMTFMLDDNGAISSAPQLSDSDKGNLPGGLTGIPTGYGSENPFGPMTLQREVPLATITDTGAGNEDVIARLWQIEYRIIQ